jgi:hypothetical protein
VLLFSPRAVHAVTAAIRVEAYFRTLLELRGLATVTFHPVFPVRAMLVAAAGAGLGLLAPANLSPTAELPRAGVVHAPSFSAPIPARVVYSPDPFVIVSPINQ